jgi:AcrR family transcriptional regulator
MTNSIQVAGPGKRERLIAAACELIHRQGVARTTLADIAAAADVPVGNVYYYFKTKDDIVAAVVKARVSEIESAMGALERRYRSPKARLKGLIRMLAERADSIADYGCPHGTLCLELAKRAAGSDPLAALPMQAALSWAEQQFSATGRRDANELAVDLLAAYQGAAVLTSTLGQRDLMVRQARRLEKWIEALRG